VLFRSLNTNAFRARITELLEEAENARKRYVSNLKKISLRKDAKDIRTEFREISDTLERIMSEPLQMADIASLYEEIKLTESDLLITYGKSDAVLQQQLANGIMFTRIAFVLLAVNVLLLLYGICLIFFDGVNQAFGLLDLEQEIRKISSNREFKNRISLQFPDTAHSPEKWQLRLQSRKINKETHVTFTAKASHENIDCLLWGKAYHWAGIVKSLQRIFGPAYGEATWQALVLMHNAGLGSPFPLMRTKVKLKRSRVPIGSIILAGHVGEVISLKKFMSYDFPRFAPEERSVFIQQLIDFLSRVHGLGIHRFGMRYVHVAVPHAADECLRFYLFDLDKVHICERCSGWWYRYNVRRDRKKILRFLRNRVSPDEFSTAAEFFKTSASMP